MISAKMNSEDRTAVMALLSNWAESFSGSSIESILACYSEDAFLWGTYSAELRRTPKAIRDYFEPYFALEVRRIEFEEQLIRIHGDTALCNGCYKVVLKKKGRLEEAMARYSFTCMKQDGRWKIVDHHSSLVPE